jgi:hypothetical protein
MRWWPFWASGNEKCKESVKSLGHETLAAAASLFSRPQNKKAGRKLYTLGSLKGGVTPCGSGTLKAFRVMEIWW